MSGTAEHFFPVWWLSNRHLQSCFTTFFPSRARVKVTWERLELPDGDFTDLCWAGTNQEGPIFILLHGLEGSAQSPCIQAMLNWLAPQWKVVVLHFRGCSGRLNRLSRSYHAGDYGDLAYLMGVLQLRYPRRPLIAIGFSLGGSILLRYLANHPEASLQCAVAVSVPFELQACVDYLSNFYHWVLLRTLKQKTLAKIRAGYDMPVSEKELRRLNNFTSFDNAVTAPLHGFCGAKHYYESASIRSSLKRIGHPTLIIHALDDPLIPAHCVPAINEVSSHIMLDLHQKGGHLGFIEGLVPGGPVQWLKKRIGNFLKNFIIK